MKTLNEVNPKMSDRIKFATIYWVITIIACLYFVPAIMIAYLNPFWFREDFHNLLVKQIDKIAFWRYNVLKPIVEKYKLFDILKNS